MKGVNIIQNLFVQGILQKNGCVTGVRTARGDISAEYVVNCTGMWARQFGGSAGICIPNQAAEHYYLITEEVKGLDKNLPVLEDPSCHAYYREEAGGFMIGLFEPECAAWKVEGIPNDFSFAEIPPDLDRMAPHIERAMARVPGCMKLGIKKFFCGPESFTPDIAPIVGEAPELKNYFVAAGLNSVGIITGGGLGRVVAHWIVNGSPDVDVTGINIDRFHPYQTHPDYLRARNIEAQGLVYKCHYPTRTPQTARGAKMSPIHDRLAARGAYFKDVSGWESPDWYAPKGHKPEIEKLSWGRQHWFPWWEAEHKACREGVILMDMSFMSKFLVEGPDAGKVLNYISANNVNTKTETITYTQWLNVNGKLEADLTVIKLTEENFMVVATDTMHRHVETWLRRNLPEGSNINVFDVTAGFAQINIQGPKSRELLQSLTTSDLSNASFPFRAAREIEIGEVKVLCARITYLGELGYELYIKSGQATGVYDLLVEAGKGFGLCHAGLKALSSLRMEKAYRDYGHDIDNTDDPFETGLGFAVELQSDRDFIGKKAALLKKSLAPYTRNLVQVLVKDPEPLLYHAEPVLRDKKPVGYIRAGSYGFSLGGAVGLAMIEADQAISKQYIESGKWEVDIAGKLYPASVSLKSLYDPDMKKIKA